MGVYLLVSAGFGVFCLLLRRYDGGGGFPNQQRRLGTATPWLGLRPGRYAPTARPYPSPAPHTLVLSTQLWGVLLPSDRIAAIAASQVEPTGHFGLAPPFSHAPSWCFPSMVESRSSATSEALVFF